ncbi:MAG: nicotinate phosphoribosyltransferase [Candidatus Woesearchaeota archaeon]|nr:nicotinate phosphoribosyltransferase [Candidatus Woesearchaeota archaeon]
MGNKTMLTDLYQITMMAGYVDNQKDDVATFDLFIRDLPKDWGYFIAAGIEDAVDYITSIKFTGNDIDYLRQQGIFEDSFLSFLKDFRFTGEVYAVKEGSVVFPNEPIMRVTANRTQAQFLETTLLNMINFQTMIASKASRVVDAASGASVIEFGLRRAQEEDAALKGARAAYIGGAVSTSNVKAGMQYGIPISGTQAHSFIMSYDDEIDAFRAYARTFPKKSILLIDTYNTCEGARKAAVVAKEMEMRGEKLVGVRLDSGDLDHLSKRVRSILNEEGLPYVKIFVSNDLNEYKIAGLVQNHAPIDAYGVGTEMITAKPVSALPGVYKLVEDVDGPKMKFSPGKLTYPGVKQVYRAYGDDGMMQYDIMALDGEFEGGESLLEQAVSNGKRVSTRRELSEIRQYALEGVSRLPHGLRCVEAVGRYEVKVSEGIHGMIAGLNARYSLVK